MLELKNIVKVYGEGDNKVEALKGVTINFRRNEFVSVLGPSGCGKTTLLNIVGGLDRYTSGDLVISGESTKTYKAYDWDAYRNHSVGFVFQSYNLIPHQSVLGNVELALTLSGIKKAERRARAKSALERVGLGDQINKRPNQLSGGQMQRVAIARALVNDPEIILADEPTGALDSVTSVQVLDLLKEIALDRLVIMVTHNNELAEKYSTRIIKLFDGEMEGDSNPFSSEEVAAVIAKAHADAEKAEAKKVLSEKELKAAKRAKKKHLKKTSMSIFTALNLSLRNLLTKKGRTFMTSFAGSIGIIGIALVLAISNGFSLYIERIQQNMLGNFPISVTKQAINFSEVQNWTNENKYEEYPEGDDIIVYNPLQNGSSLIQYNFINQEYVDFIEAMPEPEKYANDIQYSYAVPMNVIREKKDGEYVLVDTIKSTSVVTGTVSSLFQEALANEEFMLSQYDELYGSYPKNSGDIALIIDEYNRLSTSTLRSLGIDYSDSGNPGEDREKFKFSELLGMEFKLVSHDGFYNYDDVDDSFSAKDSSEYPDIYENSTHTKTLKISGILRVKKSTAMSLYSSGLLYLPSLTEEYLEKSRESALGIKQKASEEYYMIKENGTKKKYTDFKYDFFGANPTVEQLKEYCLTLVGASEIPSGIYIYPKSFESKNTITDYLNGWNKTEAGKANKILYTDASSMVATTMTQLVDIIKYVLIAFAAVSLVVSSIMIGIITYVSVIERTKEIGVLRSMGARKKDIASVFNAETILIGLTAGLIGIIISYILCIPINLIINALAGSSLGMNLAVLNPLHALLLIAISMCLTLISGLFPSLIAANKDPVVALRTE